MAIAAYRLPPEIEINAKGGPQLKFDVQEAVSGQEQRNQIWAECRAKFEIAYAIMESTDPVGNYRKVLTLFYGHRAGMYPFRFKDWSDFEATDEVFGADETGASRQLSKAYNPGKIFLGTPGSLQFIRKIVLPNADIVIKISGTPTAAYTLSPGGIVVFTSDPGVAELTWTGTYDIPVRFDIDWLPVIMRKYDLAQIGSVPLREVINEF